MRVADIAYTYVLGLPVILWFGLGALATMALAYAIGFLNHRGIRVIAFKHHRPAATLSVILALAHVFLAVAPDLGL